MRRHLWKYLKFLLRWGIAVVGIWLILSRVSFRDYVSVAIDDPTNRNRPVRMQLLDDPYTAGAVFKVVDAQGHERQITREQTVNPPDRSKLRLLVPPARNPEGYIDVDFLGLDLAHDEEHGRTPEVRRLLIAESSTAPGRWVLPSDIRNGYQLEVPHPRIEIGLRSMVRHANPWLLAVSLIIFPITILLTSWRWQRLMRAVDIDLPFSKAVALNMVGMFYNTFIPTGSTGGDLIKAYYASRHTPHKVRAVTTVFVDRVIGLVVLLILGGMMAMGYYLASHQRQGKAAMACLYVAAVSAALLAVLAAGALVLLSRGLRRAIGISYLISRLPMQDKVNKLHETLSMYRQQPRLILWSLAATIPVHLTVMVAGMLAGKALHLPLSTSYYFVVVPMSVLASAVPISPQGVGIMEAAAIYLTAGQGATIGQAFALTLSLRFQQIFWNFWGGIFVFTGHYRAKEAETQQG